jgi:hypothetical protein
LPLKKKETYKFGKKGFLTIKKINQQRRTPSPKYRIKTVG